MRMAGQSQVSASIPPVGETWWASALVWMGVEDMSPTGVRTLDRSISSESLYRLSYLDPRCV